MELLVAFLVYCLVLVLIIGALVLLVRRAPFIDEPYKGYACWLLMAIGILLAILHALPLLGIHAII